jgi:hypothetical protein
MAGVGDLDFCQVVDRWVVDRGIKMFGRCGAFIPIQSYEVFPSSL